ncbi:MAG: helix-turn-helix domain-containing protein [Prevotellaceae bacterium]|nr:helix-turn-helix domain-containing protein [Prevotellaceae bacterium]
MEKENIRTVNIEDFKTFSNAFDYIDDDIAIIGTVGLNNYNFNQETMRLGFFLIVFCVDGCIQMDVNYKSYRLERGDVLFGMPNSIIGNMLLSPKNQMKFSAFSTGFLQRLFKADRIWDTAVYLHHNPVKHTNGEKVEPVYKLLHELLVMKIGDTPHPYHKEMIRYLFSALFCQLMGDFSQESAHQGNAEEPKEVARQVHYIFRRFAEMLSQDNGMHRSVAYYADALCYSPKHFSKVIKQASGHTPIELINKAAMEHIKYRLKHSEKSIKEIAEEFNFSNQSFFGKYVKAHLGMSPAQYRDRK